MGYRGCLIRPYPVRGLTFVRGSHESMYGRIASHWRRENGRFHLDVTIPPNTTATVYVPATDKSSVTAPSGVKLTKFVDKYALFELKSGTYSFSAAEL